jgi:hypothetical protein
MTLSFISFISAGLIKTSVGQKTKLDLTIMRISTSTWKQVLQILGTIITTIAGTLCVQSCM